MKNERKIYFSENLPKIGDVVRVTYPYTEDAPKNGIFYLPFEAIIIGRAPYNFIGTIASISPNENIEIRETSFQLSFAAHEFETKLIHTQLGWKIFPKNSLTPLIIQVEIIK